jgi:glycosyltransferase involved in cell wall biosynthesis
VKFAGARQTGDIAASQRTWYGRLKLRFLRSHVRFLVCPSREIREELLRAGFADERIAVIPNGVDTAFFSPAALPEKNELRRELGIGEQETVVIYTGRLHPGKGVESLLAAWTVLAERFTDRPLRLLIVGSGRLEPALRDAFGTAPSVRFCGWQEEVRNYLRASDIFVLPSLGEGMSNALVEAMSCGLACVASRIGGNSELITDGRNGLLFEPGSRERLAAQLAGLLEDSRRRRELGECARQLAVERLSFDTIVKEYAALYERMVHPS